MTDKHRRKHLLVFKVCSCKMLLKISRKVYDVIINFICHNAIQKIFELEIIYTGSPI